MMKDVDRRIKNALAGERKAFRSVIGSVTTDGPVQLASGEGLSSEPVADAELFQQYGHTSVPLPGTMAVIVPVGGDSSHAIVIATEHGTYRLKGLVGGEVAMYTDEGDSVVLSRGRIMNITTKTLKINASEEVNVTTKAFNLTADDSASITTKTALIAASTSTTLDTPSAKATHELEVAEKITGSGGMSMSGGDGVEMNGDMKLNGTATIKEDAVIGGKSYIGHKHPYDDGLTDVPS